MNYQETISDIKAQHAATQTPLAFFELDDW